MNKIAKMTATDRADVFAETAERKVLAEAIIEKDFWVCWTLKQLFSIEALVGRLLFKGGTSLSKIFLRGEFTNVVVTISSLPSPLKSPTATELAPFPAERTVAAWKVPSPFPNKILTVPLGRVGVVIATFARQGNTSRSSIRGRMVFIPPCCPVT